MSVSAENSLFEPFISCLICAMRAAPFSRYPREEYVLPFDESDELPDDETAS